MSLFKRNSAGPRIICCTNCSGSQEIPAAAQSVICRHCNASIRVTDQKITQYSATVSLETCGSVVIEKKGALVAQKRVVASELMLKGSLKGNIVIYDTAHIAAGAQMVGNLKARALIVDDGATIKGFIQVIPGDGLVTVEPPQKR
ncbi:MAG: polymer-forming cytoskeletal protein [Planctomycetota bacterium]